MPALIISIFMATGTWAQTAAPVQTLPTDPSAQPGSPNQQAATNSSASPQPSGETQQLSQREKAELELKQQEKQRVMGVMPNFNTTDDPNAAPLSSSQKFRLMMKSATDPFQFVLAGLDSGYSQAEKDFSGYGQGAGGYFKRFGASYGDQFDGQLWGNAILPVLLHEDPRYFRKGTGTFLHRLLWVAETTVIAKRDNGTWGPNYANVFGNIIAGSISNVYYPQADRGVGLTFQRAFTVTAEGAVGALFFEFWPDISRRGRRLLHRHQAEDATAPPAK